MKNKILEKEKELMYEKKKQIEDLTAKGEDGAADLKNLLSNVDVVHILTDFPNNRNEIDALEK